MFSGVGSAELTLTKPSQKTAPARWKITDGEHFLCPNFFIFKESDFNYFVIFANNVNKYVLLCYSLKIIQNNILFEIKYVLNSY